MSSTTCDTPSPPDADHRCARDDCDGRGHVYKPASGLSAETTEDQ